MLLILLLNIFLLFFYAISLCKFSIRDWAFWQASDALAAGDRDGG